MNSNKKRGYRRWYFYQQKLSCCIPFELLEFLSVDYSYKTKDVFSPTSVPKPHRVLSASKSKKRLWR